MNKYDFNIVEMETIYTGGNIWCFLGKLTDGNYFFASDLMYDIMIVDADPRETEDSWYREWQEEHMVYEYNCDTTHDEFLAIYKWLEANNSHCGVNIEYSIDKLNEIFQTNERK